VIIDHSRGLAERIDDRGAAEFEAAVLEPFRRGARFGSDGSTIVRCSIGSSSSLRAPDRHPRFNSNRQSLPLPNRDHEALAAGHVEESLACRRLTCSLGLQRLVLSNKGSGSERQERC